MSRRKLVGSALLAATIGLLPIRPAAANDTTLQIVVHPVSNATVVLARATWNDSRDTLCVQAFPGDTGSAEAWFARPNGTIVRIRDIAGKHTARTCTRNLSIREDYRTRLDLQWRSNSRTSYITSAVFYT